MDAKDNLKRFVHREITEQFKTAYDFAQTFKCDYQNTCKWFKDYRKMPVKIALEYADYLNMRLVVFRELN